MTSFLGPVRAAYDAMAGDYVDQFGTGLDAATDAAEARELLTDLAHHAGPGPVLDAGCGAGRTTALLHGLGVRVAGLDLSASMLRIARRVHPGPPYLTGSLTALPVPDGSLAGLAAWYSVIHVPPAVLPPVLAGFRRAVRPGGRLVLAFQEGHEISHHDAPFGHATPLDFHRHRVDRVAAQLTDAEFRVDRAWTRPANRGERTPQSFLTAS